MDEEATPHSERKRRGFCRRGLHQADAVQKTSQHFSLLINDSFMNF